MVKIKDMLHRKICKDIIVSEYGYLYFWTIVFIIFIILFSIYYYQEYGDCMFKFGREYYRCISK